MQTKTKFNNFWCTLPNGTFYLNSFKLKYADGQTRKMGGYNLPFVSSLYAFVQGTNKKH